MEKRSRVPKGEKNVNGDWWNNGDSIQCPELKKSEQTQIARTPRAANHRNKEKMCTQVSGWDKTAKDKEQGGITFLTKEQEPAWHDTSQEQHLRKEVKDNTKNWKKRTLSIQNCKASQTVIQTWGHNKNILRKIKLQKVECTKKNIENTLGKMLHKRKARDAALTLGSPGV